MNGYELKNPIVSSIGSLHFSGDTVPPEFFQEIKFESGKPDLLAVLILADVLYWYRPVKPRDERSGLPQRWRQKFAGNKLCRSYAALANKFGATDRMTRDACHRLEALGLLTITTRPKPEGGTDVFLEPVFLAVAKIVNQSGRLTPERESDTKPTHVETSVGLRQNVSRLTSERESHDNERARDETSIKTSTKTSLSAELPFSHNWQGMQEQQQSEQTDSLSSLLCKLHGITERAGFTIIDRYQRLAMELEGVGATVDQVARFWNYRTVKPQLNRFTGDFVAWRATENGKTNKARSAEDEAARQEKIQRMIEEDEKNAQSRRLALTSKRFVGTQSVLSKA